ncbi:maltose acetyltransferase [Sodalis sp. TME1]|nr:maltose acetyltransferase [Sodalis sp. TME1]
MKEKDKAAAGSLYDPCGCPQLSQERQGAKVTLWQYNQCDPRDGARRQRLLKSLLGSSGDGLCIEPPFHCDYGYHIHVGKNVYANVNLVILDCAPVTLGDNVFIAPNVGMYTAGHPLDVARRNQGLEYALPITIGNNVWIGGGVTILPGVTIGDNTVIGAGSVVTRDIPASVLAFGYPCRVARPLP